MALTPHDRMEILDLYMRYSHAIDAMDADNWLECWSADGMFSPPLGPNKGKIYRGHGELRGIATQRPENYPRAHWVGNPVFVENVDHVEGTCYGMTIDVSGGQPLIAAHYIFRDQIVRDAGRWRFRSRRPSLDAEHRR